MTQPFSVRMWNAVSFIERGGELSRQLDAAFENFDGDAMCAALWTLAESRPKLKQNIRRYVNYPESPETIALIGLPIREIREVGRRQRAKAMAFYFPGETP